MQPIKGKKYYKLDFTKLKAFCSVKDTVKRFKKNNCLGGYEIWGKNAEWNTINCITNVVKKLSGEKGDELRNFG